MTTTRPPRDLLLAELDADGSFPVHVLLGTMALGPLLWSAPPSEVVKLDDTEVWRIANTTDDAHPIHLHLVDFQILDRLPLDSDGLSQARRNGTSPVLDDFITGPAMPPGDHELGPKDTMMALPGTVTRLVARFDRAGSYVWHCHILEHEDNEMMRPLVVAP